MDQSALIQKIDELRRLPHETEWVEFKAAATGLDFREICRYFSALSNEANLKCQPCGWLVLGVTNDDRSICGSRYRENPSDLDSLKHEVANQIGGITFREIHSVQHPDGRVVVFEIPPAPPGIPVAFQGHWYGRDGESLGALALHELETIRGQVRQEDWSAVTCPAASIDDLDKQAIAVARSRFLAKNSSKSFSDEIPSWSDSVFLDRAKFSINGRLTRTALLLLGRTESTYFLNPFVAQITWKLEGDERAYEHFAPPFLLTTSEVYSRIRNIVQKIDVPGRLVPYEIPKFDKWVVLEALHNAVAHQDYQRQSRIIVTETPYELHFENAGRFFDGTVSDYSLGYKTPTRYRNRFLVDAMVNVNMIDSMGYGIHKMFLEQRKRFYPLPDYPQTSEENVVVRISGRVIDPSYTAVLMEKQDLPLNEVILLDQVQKGRVIQKSDAAKLRRDKLIEGRFPNLFVAAHVAASTGDRAQYIRNRAFDDDHYKNLILQYLRKYGHASHDDLDHLLYDKLSDVLSDQQKNNKIRNLRKALVEAGLIRNIGSRKFPRWELPSSDSSEEKSSKKNETN